MQTLGQRLTPDQRRAYIATARRTQPIAELLRKAKKATPRHFRRVLGGEEGKDLSFAESWRRDQRQTFRKTFKLTFCSLCSTFAPVGFPVQHTVRCSANPVDDGPYPGWAAAGITKTLASSRPLCEAA